MLTNATSDTARRVFRTTDNIYVRGVVRNDNPILAGARTAFYTNRTSTAHGASSDIPLTINHGAIGTNQTLWYASRPGGLRNTQMSGTKYFRKSAGDYSAQMHVNYTRSVTETNYNNNTFNYNYSVIAAPTNPRTTNILCTSANIGWNHAANSNIDRYTVSLTGSGNVGSVTNNSARLTNLSPNTTYTWSLSAAATHGALGNVLSGTFRTPHCPYITASNSGPIAINPGQLTASILDVNLTYHPDSNGNNWSSYGQANIAINVVAIRPNGASCSGLTATSPRYSSGSDGLQVRASGTSVSGTTLQSTTAKASFDVTSSSNTNTGRYTVCFGISSSANWVGRQPIPVMPAYIDVELRPWLQIDSPTELYQDVWRNSEAGDVHSNGPMTINVPIHHYFFRNGVAGVLSHPESQSIRPPSRLAINYTMRQVLWTYVPVQISPWKASLYDQPVTTRSFDQLRKLAQSSLDNPAENFQEVNPATTNFNSLCAQGGGVYYFKPSGGTLTRNAAQNLSSHPQCVNNRNLLFFIDGNLTHNQNLIVDTLSSTITFIVNGDIRVSPSVTRLDGVHIFTHGGRIELVIKQGFVQQPRMYFGNVEMSLLVIKDVFVFYAPPRQRLIEPALYGMCQALVIITKLYCNAAIGKRSIGR